MAQSIPWFGLLAAMIAADAAAAQTGVIDGETLRPTTSPKAIQ